MVIGAAGSIGSVSARLLAMSFDEVYLAGLTLDKLDQLKASILKDTPDAKVFTTIKYDELLGDMDMIVTATSGAGKSVLDITKVKPGCVITDVARPLDLPASEVAKRPDVLVIESGEIELPSKVKIKDIGLPPNVIYACLAETIVLALEGRFEVFTIGRDTEWEKVKEIYRLGLKHGMKLAAISGVRGVYSDADIAKVVALAKKARLTWKSGKATAKPARAPKSVAKPLAEKKTPAVKAAAPKAATPKAAGAAKPGAKAAPEKKATVSKAPADKRVAVKKAVAPKTPAPKAATPAQAAKPAKEVVAPKTVTKPVAERKPRVRKVVAPQVAPVEVVATAVTPAAAPAEGATPAAEQGQA